MKIFRLFFLITLIFAIKVSYLYSQEALQQILNSPMNSMGNTPTIQNVIVQPTEDKESQPQTSRRREKEPISQFESFVKGSNINISQFGYNFFTEPSSYVIDTKIPVGPEYLLGPGDEIRISIWGKIDANFNVVIDRDGNISIPKIGVLGVNGLTFAELKDTLYKELSKYYTGFQMNVSVGNLKSIRIYVLGNAYKPGAYLISSLSTLVSAIFDTGGPAKNGSLRNIKLIRNGNVFKELDLYDFLLKGNKRDDVRLMPEDVIYYPVVGPLVGIAGTIKRPAIYELKNEKTIKEVLELGGGLSDITFRGRVQIKRVLEGISQVVSEETIESALNNKVEPGDIIDFFTVHSDRKVVRITGAVFRPGEYGFSRTVRVRDLINLAGGLTYFAYKDIAELTRVTPTKEGPKTEKIYINLRRALEGDPKENIELKEDDYLFVRAVPEWDLYKQVTIKGEVRFPGVYTIIKGEKLSSLIERAGGFTDKAYLEGTMFIRQRVKELQQKSINDMVERLEREILSTGTGEVAVALSPEEAKVIEAETRLKRDFINRLRNVKALGRISIKMDMPERLKNTIYDMELEEGDIIEIPQNPKTVFVVGSVYNQTAFVYNDKEGVNYYINLAGGLTENANKNNMYVLKADGTAERIKSGFLGIRAESKTMPGDTIVVPEKLERIAWLRNIKDITQILYQIAVTAGVIIVAF